MTYYAGDDGSSTTVPAYDTNGGLIDLPAEVVAKNTNGDVVAITASWKAAAVPAPGQEGTTVRDIVVPLVTVPHGLWSFKLTVDGGADVFLTNEWIE